VNSDLVLIPVMVTDRQDRLIKGLAREQFRLWDEKVEQVISHFTEEDAPVSIGIVFDSSGSMRYKMDESRAAVRQFVNTANPEDEFSLVEFNDRPRTLAEFTSYTQEIQERLLAIEPSGRTALLDATQPDIQLDTGLHGGNFLYVFAPSLPLHSFRNVWYAVRIHHPNKCVCAHDVPSVHT